MMVRWEGFGLRSLAGAGLLVASMALACGADDLGGRGSSGDAGQPPGEGTDTGNRNGDGALTPGDGSGGTGSGFGPGGVGNLPEEEEKDLSAFRAPVVTGQYLWFANPESNRVALIDALSLETRVLNGGFRPTHVAAVPHADENSALVLNAGSQDATWFRLDGDDIKKQTFEVHPRANRWAVAESGRWAVAFSTAESGETLDPADGLQDITILDLEASPPSVHRLSVDYRPSALSFSEGESELIVVAAAGITIIDLTEPVPTTARWIDLHSGSGRRVSVTPDGAYALAHRSTQPVVEIIPLDGGPITEVTLSGLVTDVEISADGRRAVAVIREQRTAVVLELADIVADPADFDAVIVPGEVFGSVALTSAGDAALLYTTAVDHSRLVIVDLSDGPTYLEHRTIDVKGPIQSVQATPDGEHAIVLMGPSEGSTKPGSFAVVSLKEARFPRIEATEAPVHMVAVSSSQALVTTRSDARRIFEGHLIQMPSGRSDKLTLASPPTAVGIVTEHAVGYIAQSHSEGRVTVLNFDDARARTLTGFELASKVVE